MERYHLINILWFLIATLVAGIWMYNTQSGQSFVQWLGITFFGVDLNSDDELETEDIL